ANAGPLSSYTVAPSKGSKLFFLPFGTLVDFREGQARLDRQLLDHVGERFFRPIDADLEMTTRMRGVEVAQVLQPLLCEGVGHMGAGEDFGDHGSCSRSRTASRRISAAMCSRKPAIPSTVRPVCRLPCIEK